ncbi:DUF6551 family protein [Streptomyces nojiriensis]|uniref:DUF6551 family protein n=1 Tax=Streptomyces nojiriensis TaxID=66374 RepID=UPI00364EA27A
MTNNVKITKRHQEIPVGLLKVDSSLNAQRIFSDPWATKLEKIFDEELLLPAIVSERVEDGEIVYYTLDGQHSNEVARRVKGDDFKRDCMVYSGLQPRQEAKLFLAANRDRKPVKPYDNFRVACTADDPLAVRVKTEVESLGGDLQIGASTSANRVAAVQALLFIGAKREGLIPKVLRAVEGAWGREISTWDNMMIRAVSMVIDTNWDVVDIPRLSKTLGRAQVGKWKSLAISLTSSGGGSNSRSTPLANRIVMEYNETRNLKPENQLRLISTKKV